MMLKRGHGRGRESESNRQRGFARLQRGAALAKPLIVAAIVLLGLLLSMGLAWSAREQAERDAQLRFDRVAERLETEVLRRFKQPFYGLKGLRGAYAASPSIARADFRAYVESRQLPIEFPGVRGFGLIERVPRSQLAAFTAAARRDDAPEFEVRSSGDASDLFVIKYLEPLGPNRQAQGFDVGQEPVRREAAQRAMLTGQDAMTGRITLVQDAQKRVGYLLMVPVYRRGADPVSPAQHEQALLGLAYAPVVVEELLAGAIDVAEKGLDFELFDGTEALVENLVFEAMAVAPKADSSAGRASSGNETLAPAKLAQSEARFENSRSLSIAGRSLLLRARSSAAFDATIDTRTSRWIAAGGTALTLSLALAAWLLLSGRDRAEAMAQRMTGELERLARVARGTSNAVIATDAQGRITWVNEGFSRITGYSVAEALGCLRAELIGGDTGPGAAALGAQELAGLALSRAGLRGEQLCRRKDGRPLWVDADIQPVFDANGQHAGFIEISLDITEGKQNQLQLAQVMSENKALLDTIHQQAIVSVTDPTGRIIEANVAFCRISGYAQEELLGQKHSIVNSGTQGADFWPAVWATISQGKSWHGEVCNRAKSGELYWVDSIIAPVLGPQGQVEKYISIRIDITAAKRAAADLAEQQDRLNRIIEGTNAGTWDWNVQTGEARFNERWAEMLGWTLEELAPVSSQTWVDLCHPDDMHKAKESLMRHFFAETQFYECELRMRHRDGHWVYVLARGKLYKRSADGEPSWIAGTHLDISAAKAAEELLLHKQMVLDRAERLTELGAWEVDMGTQLLSWSEQTYRLHDMPPDRLVTLEEALAHFSAADSARLAEAMQRAVDHSEAWDMELSLRTDLGRFIWVRSVGEAVFDDSGALRIVGTYQDITERRALEAETKRSHQVLQSVLENLPCALSVFDADLKLLAHNQQFLSLLEFPPELFEEQPVRFENIIRFNAARGEYGQGPDLEATIGQIVERALHPTEHQFARTRPNGRTLEVRGSPMPAGGFVTTYVDITERRALEDEQRRSAELLKVVLESLPCGLSLIDPELRLTLYNSKYAELYGLDSAFLQEQPLTVERVARLLHERGEDGAIDIETALQRARQHGEAALLAPHQWERQRPNGLSLEMHSNPVPSGGFVTTYMDVGERRRAEAELRRAESLLRGSIDAVGEAFVLYDPEDRLVFCNEKYRQMYAASSDLIVPGARFEDIIRGGALRGQYRDAEGRIEDWVRERMAAHRQGDTLMVQKLDDQRWIRVIERKMVDGHTVGFRIDITDLMLATEAAEEASRSKSQFLANMSHEIRTPMNAILGMLKLLQKTQLTTRQLDYASKTEGAARSLLGLLNDILDFSKVEAGKMELDPQPFSIDHLLRDLSVILSANVGAKPLEILFDLDPALPSVLIADAMRLQQVLINLGGNAIKFTQRGEVVVSVNVLSLSESEAELEFAVRDSGIGIAPEHQKHIFSGFSQAEASTTRRFGGTGLGLAISQRLVHLMGGTLALQSEPGRGSCFSFKLRMGMDGQAIANPGTNDEAETDLRVLLVDDNPIALEVLGAMAEGLGWRVDLASSGELALTQLTRAAEAGTPYQVVLMDWQMPGMDGFETTQRIRALGGLQAMPVVVMVTAHGREVLSQRSEADQQLLNGFLVKPVTPTMLLETVLASRAEPGSAASTPKSAPVAAAKPLQGMRILVVEDNLNNQQVAKELLEDVGAAVKLADNGQVGVDLLRADSQAFDIVLMDMQMPVMDGYTAARLIRSELGLTKLPVVAMTANAMPADREACLAAGMNEHVGKPFDLERLVDLLLQLTHRGDASVSAASGAALSAGAAADVADAGAAPRFASLAVPTELRERAAAQGINVQAAMDRFMGKTELFQRMVKSFCISAAELPPKLDAWLLSGATPQRGEAAMALHSFKGLAATVGAEQMASWGAEGESVLKRGDNLGAEWISGLAQQIEAGCRDMLGLAQALCDLSPKPATKPVPAAQSLDEFKRAMNDFMQLLSNFDLGATDAFARLREQFADRLKPEMESLDAAVAGLDFERAQSLCQSLLRAAEVEA
ncbi:PAS-domain containing protein [Paucibacter sp. AS339]|uniref:PAS-domain containing protein n=1 Tax=Paucibacter hankyongi TaxID=3133434 RepID=UPI0030A9E3F4